MGDDELPESLPVAEDSNGRSRLGLWLATVFGWGGERWHHGQDCGIVGTRSDISHYCVLPACAMPRERKRKEACEIN